MAITTQPQPEFIVDNESERNPTWPNGAHIYCKDTKKSYRIISGAFELVSSSSTSGEIAWGQITGTLSAQTDLAEVLDGKTTLSVVKADSDIADALAKKHANTLDHSNSLDHSNASDPTANEKLALAGTSGAPSTSNKFVTDADSRNTNTRTPSAHYHPPTDVTGTAVITTDSRLTDDRTPLIHGNTKHSSTFVTQSEIDTSINVHKGITGSVHNFDASGNSPAQTHDNTRHSSAFALNSDLTTHTSLTTTAHGGILPSTAFVGLAKITISPTAPIAPGVGDLWVDTT